MHVLFFVMIVLAFMLISGSQYPNQQHIAKIYDRYEQLRSEAGALDFDDLLIETVRLLRDASEIRQKYRQYFKHILIDEYQDTNAAQYAIVKYLVPAGDSGTSCETARRRGCSFHPVSRRTWMRSPGSGQYSSLK